MKTARRTRRPDPQWHFSRLRDEESGATLVWAALMMTMVLGLAGLGLDASSWYLSKRELQTVADNAVLEGVAVKGRGAGDPEVKQAAVAGASLNGFVDGTDGTVTVNIPPLSGPNAGNPEFIEVIAEREASAFLSSLVLGRSTMTIASRAVGAITNGGEHCLLALDPSIDAALEFTGNSNVTLNCGIASNSNSSQSILINGSADLATDPIQTVGQIEVTGSGILTTTTPPQPFSPPVPDPFAGLALPSAASLACDYNQYKAKNETLSPGVYCDGLDMKFTVTLLPGVYILLDGSLTINANATITGNGVTFVFLGSSAATVGGIANINGNSTVNLTAPGPGGQAAGPYAGQFAGLVFAQDPNAVSGFVNQINGGANMQLNGAIYFPNQEINYSGNSAQTGCLKVVGRKITFTGNSNLSADPATCAALGVPALNQTRQRIVE